MITFLQSDARPFGEVGHEGKNLSGIFYSLTAHRRMIVADNALISCFTIDGEFTEEAVEVRRKDPEWTAPLFWRSEFLNVLWPHVRQGEFGLDLAIQHIRPKV